MDATLMIFAGVALVASVVWLAAAGSFGYGDARRSDWIGLLPFLAALVVREGFTVHSVQELEIQFANGPVGRHSVVYPLLQMFFVPIVTDPHQFTMHMNGVLGSFASLALYLFVRQRLNSRRAGFLCGLFLALHPVLARFSPTDGPYALLLASWFSGLALLSAPNIDGLGLLGGATLLGIAATSRMEGGLFLIASLLMLDSPTLIRAARHHRVFATAGFLAVYALVAVQMMALLSPNHLPHYSAGVFAAPTIVPLPLRSLFPQLITAEPYRSKILAYLIGLGALAGILPKFRLGLTAFLAMILVLVPVAGSWMAEFILHRMVPTYAIQTVVAGVGAYSMAAWVSESSRWQWIPVIPGVMAAFFVFAEERSELTNPYLFSDEYTLVRSRLAPGGVPLKSCTLLTLNQNFAGDIDLHDFSQVVPGVRTLDCRRTDCIDELSRGGCFYYIRSAASYYHVDGVPPACAETGTPPDGNLLTCLNEASRSFEDSIDLEPIELKTIDILHSFQDRRHYPSATAEIGLFRAHGKEPGAPEVAETSALPARAVFHPRYEPGMVPAPDPSVQSSWDQPAVPAGQDELLFAMLGGSNVLAGDCKLVSGASDNGKIEATYACPAGRVVIELAHPSKAVARSIRTARFAVTPQQGSAPPALLDALQSLIRARESEFRWQMLPTPQRSAATFPLAAGGALGLVILAWILRRPKSWSVVTRK